MPSRARSESGDHHRDVFISAAILLVFLLAMDLAFRPIGDFGVETDFYGTYAPRAAGILAGRFVPAAYGVVGPLYELLLAGGLCLGIPAFLWGKLLSTGATVGTLLLWAAIARRLFGDAAGRRFPWLLLLSPVFVHFGSIASSDALYMVLVSAVFFALTLFESLPGATAAGAAACAACLSRYQAILLPVSALGWLAGRKEWLRRWGAFLVIFPAAFLAVGLILALAGVRMPQPDFLYNIHFETNRGAEDWDRYTDDTAARGDPMDALVRSLPQIPAIVLRNVPGHIATEATRAAGLPLSLLFLIGLVALRRRSSRPTLLRLLAVWAIQFAALLPVIASERYALVQVPVVAAIAAGGLSAEWPLTIGRKRFLDVLFVLVLLGGYGWNVRGEWLEVSRQPRYLLDVASRVRGTVRPGASVMARKPHLPYLLGARYVPFADAPDLAGLKTRMEETRPDYVFYGTSEFALRPRFHFLTFPHYRPAGWRTVDWVLGVSALYGVDQEFYQAEIPPDDPVLRNLQNATLEGAGSIEAARRLAGFEVESGRCQAALEDYQQLRKFVTLTDEELRLEELCRSSLAGSTPK